MGTDPDLVETRADREKICVHLRPSVATSDVVVVSNHRNPTIHLKTGRAGLCSQLGISPDYFTAVPDEVPDQQLRLYRDALQGLTPAGRGGVA